LLLPNCFSGPETKVKRRARGRPILPIDCLFLLFFDKSVALPEQSSYRNGEQEGHLQ